MDKSIASNTVVILAESHNPTLMSDLFLLDSGIIKNKDEISSKHNNIITPAFSQITFVSGEVLTLDQERLIIAGKEGDGPFEKGMKYCDALKYIKCKAVGINFDMLVSDFDSKSWFDNYSKKGLQCTQVNYTSPFNENDSCKILVNYWNDIQAKITFNFHYQIENTTLGNLDMNFKEERDKNFLLVQNFIDNLFI